MKRKYSGLLTIIIALSAFLSAASYGIWTWEAKQTEARILKRISPLPAVTVPSMSVINEMDSFENEMEAVIKPAKADAADVNLSLFAYQPVKTAEPVWRPEAGKSISADHVLSLAFVAGEKRFCIIDDIFYEEGSRLPDGSVIVRVEPQRVMVKYHDMKYWIPLSEKEVTAQKEGK